MNNDDRLYGIAIVDGITTLLALVFSILSCGSIRVPPVYVILISGLGCLAALQGILCVALVYFRHKSEDSGKRRTLLQEQSYLHREEDYKYHALYQRADEVVRKENLFLEQRYSINDLAQALGTNRTDLSTAFKKNTPGGFCRYINSYRLEFAIALMNDNPDLRVEDVSCMSGFASSNTFGTQFKNYTNGTTPRDYLADLRASRRRNKNSASRDAES